MSDVSPLVTAKEYVLSNGTKVMSEVPVNFYTESDTMKIIISGAILVIAILVATYAMYQWWQQRYLAWRRQTELEAMVAAGMQIDMSEYPEPKGADMRIFAIVGILACIAGAVMFLLP